MGKRKRSWETHERSSVIHKESSVGNPGSGERDGVNCCPEVVVAQAWTETNMADTKSIPQMCPGLPRGAFLVVNVSWAQPRLAMSCGFQAAHTVASVQQSTVETTLQQCPMQMQLSHIVGLRASLHHAAFTFPSSPTTFWHPISGSEVFSLAHAHALLQIGRESLFVHQTSPSAPPPPSYKSTAITLSISELVCREECWGGGGGKGGTKWAWRVKICSWYPECLLYLTAHAACIHECVGGYSAGGSKLAKAFLDIEEEEREGHMNGGDLMHMCVIA